MRASSPAARETPFPQEMTSFPAGSLSLCLPVSTPVSSPSLSQPAVPRGRQPAARTRSSNQSTTRSNGSKPNSRAIGARRFEFALMS